MDHLALYGVFLSDSGCSLEGPFDSRQLAEDFIDAEVGVAAFVVRLVSYDGWYSHSCRLDVSGASVGHLVGVDTDEIFGSFAFCHSCKSFEVGGVGELCT